MAVFVVISQPDPKDGLLPAAIAREFPGKHYALGNQSWLVASPGTAQDVSNKLGVSEGENGAAVVLQISGYFGRANPNIWTWIKQQWEASSNGG